MHCHQSAQSWKQHSVSTTIPWRLAHRCRTCWTHLRPSSEAKSGKWPKRRNPARWKRCVVLYSDNFDDSPTLFTLIIYEWFGTVAGWAIDVSLRVYQCMSYSVPILIVCCHCCVFVKVILKEREEKKRLRLLEDGVTVDVSAEIDDVVGADDNSQQAGEQEENLSPDGTQVHLNLIVLAASCVFSCRTCTPIY